MRYRRIIARFNVPIISLFRTQMQIKYYKRKTKLKIRTYNVNTQYCQSIYTTSILFLYTVSNFSFAITRLNSCKVIGFYILISLHKNLHNR